MQWGSVNNILKCEIEISIPQHGNPRTLTVISGSRSTRFLLRRRHRVVKQTL